jgi:hypothetical protein
MIYDPEIIKSQQEFVKAVDKHGMPIDYAGDEPGGDGYLWITAVGIVLAFGLVVIFS